MIILTLTPLFTAFVTASAISLHVSWNMHTSNENSAEFKQSKKNVKFVCACAYSQAVPLLHTKFGTVIDLHGMALSGKNNAFPRDFMLAPFTRVILCDRGSCTTDELDFVNFDLVLRVVVLVDSVDDSIGFETHKPIFF